MSPAGSSSASSSAGSPGGCGPATPGNDGAGRLVDHLRMPAPSAADRRAPTPTTFAVTYDYRCPFARNAHEHVLTALENGAAWNVRYVPFSLGQVHVAEGDPDIWETPENDSGLLAHQVSVVVRDRFPD